MRCDYKRSMNLNIEILSKAADQARGLCMDAVEASQSGHLGLPLGCAEIGAVLFGHALRYNPDQPRWINRDIFVLSAGHGSMFLYSWLHMSGYDLPMSEIKRFRQLHSKTPGHPEFADTPGVECSTGPLGRRETPRQRQTGGDHRAYANRKGHSRSRGHIQGARRSGLKIRRCSPQGARLAGRTLFRVERCVRLFRPAPKNTAC